MTPAADSGQSTAGRPPGTARAAVLTGERSIEVRSLDLPATLAPGHALLRIEGNGLCGSDHDAYVGKLAAAGIIRYPVVVGHEMVGVVEAIGPPGPDPSLRIGDRVAVDGVVHCGSCHECDHGIVNQCRNRTGYSTVPLRSGSGLWGGLADLMELMPGTRTFPVSAELAVQDAVLFNPLANGFEWALRSGGVGYGDRVLVMGAGQRGLACCVAASVAGARQVIVTGLHADQHKLRLAADFGATDAIDVEEHDLVPEVRRLTGGALVDVAIDVVPTATSPVSDGLECLRTGGTLVLAGVKGADVHLRTDRIWQKSLRVQGAFGRSAWAIEAALRVIETQRFPFERLHSHTFLLHDVEHAIRVLGGEVPGEEPLHITVVP